ncbi:hypothetical protein [Pengzhenrongella sicca]|uniref:Uncharacterized protein n=1 Tax=Pengzhenrongella sicca TaxID=2819238 RepID=A0A8A4ZH93_9MICO|nr:hypothetical protein [Pengzhenrongella sicca]QTE30761.1 hypothetical protein J4E96_07425 [Pengzhenrongella sicca]
MSEADEAITVKLRELEIAHEEQRLAMEIAHKERLLAMEFAYEGQLSRRNRRIEWAALGSVALVIVAVLVATLTW